MHGQWWRSPVHGLAAIYTGQRPHRFGADGGVAIHSVLADVSRGRPANRVLPEKWSLPLQPDTGRALGVRVEPGGTNNTGCYINSPAASVPSQNISDFLLSPPMLTAIVGVNGLDLVMLSFGDQFFSTQLPTGFLGLNQQGLPSQAWWQAEFNVFGLWDSSQAQFNAGTTITVTNGLNLAFGPAISTSCMGPNAGTTGETNDLDLISGSCSVNVLPISNRNQMSFTETNVPVSAPNQITATLNGNGSGAATGLTFDAGPPSKSLCQNPISTEGPPGTYSLPLPVLAGLTAMMCPGPTNYETFGYYAAPYLSKSCPGDTSPAVVPPTFQLDNNGDASILVGQGYPGQGC